MKVVLNLWDGTRFDAIFKVNQWMGLPNLFRVINNGVLFTNVYTQTPVLTPTAVGRIMHNRHGKPLSKSLWEKCRARSCYIGYPEDERRKHFPNCDLVDCLYDRRAEAEKIRRVGSLERHRITTPDQLRLDIACKKIPHNDFSFVYFHGPDTYAHECRDAGRHIYCWKSPYVHAIKECDRLLGHLLRTLDWCAPNDYVIIIMADHGMTDEGRHSIAQWDDKEVMQVPLAMMGKGIRAGWMEQTRYYTHDVTSGIVGLFKGDADRTMFRWALRRHAR
jgi:arylsulfatase A-like enzyme